SSSSSPAGYSSFFFQAEDGIRDFHVTGVQTCALPIYPIPPTIGHPHYYVWSCDSPLQTYDPPRTARHSLPESSSSFPLRSLHSDAENPLFHSHRIDRNH